MPNVSKKLFKSRFLSLLNTISSEALPSSNHKLLLYVPDRALLKKLNEVISWSEIQRYGVSQVATSIADQSGYDTKTQQATEEEVILFCDPRQLIKPEPPIEVPPNLKYVIYCTWRAKNNKSTNYEFDTGCSDFIKDDESQTDKAITGQFENEEEFVLRDMLNCQAFGKFYPLHVPVFQLDAANTEFPSYSYVSEDYKLYQNLIKTTKPKKDVLESKQGVFDGVKKDVPMFNDKTIYDMQGLISGVCDIFQIHDIRSIGKVLALDGLNDNSLNFVKLLNRKLGLDIPNLDDLNVPRVSDDTRNLHQKPITKKKSMEDAFMVDVDCNMIVLDRSLDCLTPLLTELSYGGILNELDASKFSELSAGAGLEKSAAQRKLPSDSSIDESDFIWDELKGKNFGDIGYALNSKLQKYDELTTTKDKTDLKELSSILNINNIRMSELLKKHIDISSEVLGEYKMLEMDDIVEFEQDLLSGNINDSNFVNLLQEYIFNGVYSDFRKMLKILCCYSLLKKGIVDKDYDTLINLLVDQYSSVPLLSYLICLKDCNLLIKRSRFNQLIKSSPDFKLLTNFNKYLDLLDYNDNAGSGTSTSLLAGEKNGSLNDALSYCYCGVVPLMTRLVQYSFKVNPIQPTLKLLNNIQEMVKLYEFQLLPITGTPPTLVPLDTSNNKQETNKFTKKTVKTVIVVLGGLTMSELSTLRQLNSSLNNSQSNTTPFNHEFIILSNTIINGYDYISQDLCKNVF
ncbi:hypothetical protein ACO0RG_002045 [Hanseniaspora osmophila]